MDKSIETAALLWSKMAFFNWAWQKVKVLPHLLCIKILIKNEYNFQMRYNMSLNSQWFQKYKPSNFALKKRDRTVFKFGDCNSV